MRYTPAAQALAQQQQANLKPSKQPLENSERPLMKGPPEAQALGQQQQVKPDP